MSLLAGKEVETIPQTIGREAGAKTAFTVSAGFECLELFYKKNVDLYLCYCGIEECSGGHSFGPARRSEYLIHYILSGKGVYQTEDQTYHVGKGEYFLICPGQTTFYQADTDDPWIYLWVGFQGIKASMYVEYLQLDEKKRLVGRCPSADILKELVEKMLSARALTFANELEREGLLYRFLAELARAAEERERSFEKEEYPKQVYVEHMLNYMEAHFDRKLRVSDMAKEIGLNSSYLSRCFKDVMNETIKEYLTRLRMEKAEILLTTTTDTVSGVANSVGYEDALAFSKAFRKQYNISPSEYRQKYFHNEQELQVEHRF